MTTPGVADPVGATERWFYAHGLPYFVEAHQADVDDALGRGRLLSVLGTALVVAAAAGVGVGLWAGDASAGVLAAMVTFGAVLVGYALVELRIWPILKWALRRTLGSLRLLFPLVTRALPLLLLFITFLFINAEVWEVTSHMDGAWLWVVVLLFSVLAVGFLLVRLPEEVDRVCAEVESSRLADQVRGTPVAESLTRLDLAHVEPAPLHGLPRANLLIVLLIAQATQVLVLSLAVFAFFIVFGRLIMTPSVIQGWTGDDTAPHDPRHQPARQRGALPGVGLPGRLRRALLHRVRRDRPDLPRPVLHLRLARARAGHRGAHGLPRAAPRAGAGRRLTPTVGGCGGPDWVEPGPRC